MQLSHELLFDVGVQSNLPYYIYSDNFKLFNFIYLFLKKMIRSREKSYLLKVSIPSFLILHHFHKVMLHVDTNTITIEYLALNSCNEEFVIDKTT